MDALSLILDAFLPIAGRSILDIGCGSAPLAGALAARAARVTGLDPNPAALATARRGVPDAAFLVASAEALPLADASFDGAVMLNALHHVPDPAAALREAQRVLKPDGRLVVVEPLAEGSYFEAMRLVEDETAVRAAAQEAIAAAVSSGLFQDRRSVAFERRERFASLDAFLARIAAVDPARLAVIASRRDEVGRVFARVAEREADGGVLLRQPLRAAVLSRA